MRMAPLLRPDPGRGRRRPDRTGRDASTRCATTLERRRDEYGFSYVVVHEPEMEAFGEVVSRLAGTWTRTTPPSS